VKPKASSEKSNTSITHQTSKHEVESHIYSTNLKVATSSLQTVRRNANTLNNYRFAIHTRNLDIHTIRAKPSRVLKEVVRLPGRRLPAAAAIRRHLKFADTNVCVHDLHAEPELACAGFVLEDNGRGDAARNEVPADGDDALGGVGELLEGVGVEVEVVVAAAGALVSDHGSDLCTGGSGDGYTLAAGFGVGPVAVGEGGAEEVGWEGVAGEGTHASGGVAAVESGLADLGACSSGACVFGCFGDGGGCRRCFGLGGRDCAGDDFC
jgi:hypothetical protein